MMRKLNLSLYFFLFLLFFYLLPAHFLLEACLINPDLNPKALGFEDFSKGQTHYEEEDWDKALDCFERAIKKSKKPRYDCSDFRMYRDGNFYRACQETGLHCEHQDGTDRLKCSDWQYGDSFVYFISNIKNETSYTVYRHAHFYFGLIQLHRGEIKNASFHFKRAVGFLDDRQLEDLFYRLVNVIDPYWIALASLTTLEMDKPEEARKLIDLAWNTLRIFDTEEWEEKELKGLVWSVWKPIPKQYLDDLKKRDLTSSKWFSSREILL